MQKSSIKIIQSRDLKTGLNFPALRKGEIHLWSISLDANIKLIEQCKASLTDSEYSKISFFKFPEIQNNYIISQGILRQLLSGYLNIAPKKIQLGRQQKGKPFSMDEPSLFFNISNSGNLCVYAFTVYYLVIDDMGCIECG